MHVRDLCCSSVDAKHIKIFRLADKSNPYVTDHVTAAKLATPYTVGVGKLHVQWPIKNFGTRISHLRPYQFPISIT